MRRTSMWSMVALGVAALAALSARAGAETLGTSTTDVSSAGSRAQETAAGNLVADAVRAAARSDVSIVAADALTGATMAHGPVSRADLKALLTDPEDQVSTLALTGSQLMVVLERSVSVAPKPFDGFLQVSGLAVVYDDARPANRRIKSVRVNGAALEPNRKYRVATLSTLAGGGLGYFRLWDEKDVTDGGPTVLDALAGYVQSQREIGPRVEGRIKAQ